MAPRPSSWCWRGRIGHLLFATHPHRLSIHEWFYVGTPCPVILAAMNLYSPLQYIVLATSRRAEEEAILCLHVSVAMQNAVYGIS